MITLKPIHRLSRSDWHLSPKTAILTAALVAFVLYLTTCEFGVNGSQHPYTTDVGELQNALARWGTIHYTGYPLYTALGSTFVTLLRVVGIAPAMGTSMYGAAWGAIGIGLLTSLIMVFEVEPLIAALSAVLFALTTSIWVFASVGEVHPMTMALSFAILIVALKYKRTGQKKYLYWLALLVWTGVGASARFCVYGAGPADPGDRSIDNPVARDPPQAARADWPGASGAAHLSLPAISGCGRSRLGLSARRERGMAFGRCSSTRRQPGSSSCPGHWLNGGSGYRVWSASCTTT